MATRSRARHFHATAKALNAAASSREVSDGMLLTATVSDVDVNAIIAGVGSDGGATAPDHDESFDGSRAASTSFELPDSEMTAERLGTLHEELRWAESKLMQASERLAEAQEARRKDLVALAIMRRELLGSFGAERAWLRGALHWFGDVRPALVGRERELASLVDNGVRTAAVIEELAAVRGERKLFDLATAQSGVQLARIDENEAASEYQVASEAYEREPDGATMRELARLRSAATRTRREAVRLRNETREQLDELGMVSGVGEITATHAFLAAEYEGDERAATRMDRVRAAQYELELGRLPEVEAAWKAGLKHPVHFMRARRSTAR